MATELIAKPNIKLAYQKLISQYLELLKLVASNQVNYLTRQMIEDHIRIKMQEILKAFTIVEYKSIPLNSENDIAWLRQEIEFLTRISGQLANLEPLQRRIFSFVWKTLVFLFLAAAVKNTGSTDQVPNTIYILEHFWDALKTALYYSGPIMIMISIILMVANYLTWKKLSYLNPGSGLEGNKISDRHENEGVNIYILEDQLFQLLGRKKPKDPPWDVWALSFLGLFLSAIFFVIAGETASIAPDGDRGVILFYFMPFAMVIMIGAIIWGRLRRQR